jgi:Domain of unknown function (DUF4326)
MTEPARLALSRRKGFNLQAASLALNGLECVNVTRGGAHKGLFGNPFIVGVDGTRAECVEQYWGLISVGPCLTAVIAVDVQMAARSHVLANLDALRGKNLACACKLDGLPCHADILLKLANAPVCEEAAP